MTMKKKYDMSKLISDEKEEIWAGPIRPMSRTISRILIHTPITANQISVFSFILILIACWFLSIGTYKSQIIGAVIAFISLIFDNVDGEIARVKGASSKFGKWLDGIIGFVSIALLMFTLAYGIDLKKGYFLLSLAIICYPMQYLIVFFYKAEIVKSNKKIDIKNSGKLDAVRYLYGSVFFYYLLLIGTVINRPLLILLFFAVFGNLFWIGLLFIQFLDLRRK